MIPSQKEQLVIAKERYAKAISLLSTSDYLVNSTLPAFRKIYRDRVKDADLTFLHLRKLALALISGNTEYRIPGVK